MSERILIKFQAKGDKKLQSSMLRLAAAQGLLEKNTREMKRALNRLTIAFEKNSRKGRLLNNTFATMRSKMLLFSFAMSLGGRQLLEFANKAAKIEQMEMAFSSLVGGVESATIAIDKLQNATDGTMSKFDLFQQANNATILGVSNNSDEMAEMFDMAQRLGRALGVDTKRSVESLITGIGRQSRLMLDNIGIIVKADQAYESYAKKLGISTDKLTEADKKHAFLNATLEAARSKVKELGPETETSIDVFDRLKASADNLGASVGEALMPALEGLAHWATFAMTGLNEFLQWTGLVSTSLEKATSKINDERVATLMLKNELSRVTEESKNYQDIKDRILARFPNYFQNLSDEEIKIKDLNKALDDHNKYLMQQIKVEAIRAGLAGLQEQVNAALAVYSRRLGTVAKSQREVDDGTRDMAKSFEETRYKTTSDFLSIGNALEMGVGEFYKTLFGLIAGAEGATESFKANFAETPEQVDAVITELVNMVAERSAILAEMMEAIFKEFGDSFEKIAEAASSVVEETEKMTPAMKTAEQQINSLTQATTSFWLSSQQGARTFKEFGNVIIQQMERIIATFIAKWATWKLMSTIFSSFTGGAPSLFGWTPGASTNWSEIGGSAAGEVGLNTTAFHEGGMIQSYHQGGNVPMIGQEGEFVMRRSAVDSIGLENLNRMNRTGQASGGANITFTGNVMSQDFIEDEAIPLIKDAIRRGADLGIG